MGPLRSLALRKDIDSVSLCNYSAIIPVMFISLRY